MKLIDQLNFMDTSSTEPAVKTGAITTGLGAVFVLVNAFWPHLLSTEKQNAILGVAVIFLPILLSLIIRAKVWSPFSVANVVSQARADSDAQVVELKRKLELQRKLNVEQSKEN